MPMGIPPPVSVHINPIPCPALHGITDLFRDHYRARAECGTRKV